MRNFLIAFFTFVVWSFFALWVYFLMLPNKQKITSNTTQVSNESVSNKTNDSSTLLIQKENKQSVATEQTIKNIKFSEPTESSGLTARDTENNIVFEFKKGITFIKNDSYLDIPVSLNSFEILLKDYMLQHPEKEIHIISFYSATENFVTPNIGLQRGSQIKNMLINAGIDSTKIVVKSNIADISFTNENICSNAIEFKFQPLHPKRVSKAIIPKEISMPNSITFSPTFSNTTILKTKKLQELLIRVTQILNQYPNAKVTLVGHTDNSGTTEENYIQGLSYAKQLRWFLTSKSIVDKKRVRILSKGESQPIKSNRTPKGSLKNKRIVLQFTY